MKKGNDILIPPAYFLNNYMEGFFVEVPEKDFSTAPQYGRRSFVLKIDNTHVITVFKGADRSKLKYVYFYIYQLTDDGRWILSPTWSDRILTEYPFQEVKTQEEIEARIAELKEKVKALNAAQEKEIKLPINEFVKKHITEIDSTRKLALFITKLMKTLFSEKHFVTEKQLLYFSTPKAGKRYKTFKIRKKNGGLREINAPVHHLDKILFVLNIIFKSLYTPNNAVMGFTEGKSIADNAARHTGQHYVFNIDLKDFFTSIPQARVWGRIQCAPFNFSRAVANVVAGLCCATNSETGKNVLPQGAPTSPLLTNAICDRLDRQLTALSKKYGLHYSRYADDITFSSMHNVYQEDSDFRKELKTIIEGQNFCINDKKTRLLRTGQRQEVTGLTVNSKVNVTRKYVRDIRYILHLWESKGYAFAYSKFYKFYKTEKGYIKKGEPVMENVIGGKLNYLRMIKGAGNECYQKLLQRYDKLQQIIYVDNNTDKGHNYVYVQQYTLTDFENDFKTKITLQISDDEKLVGKCNLFGMDKTISISHKTQEELCPIISHLKVGDTFASEHLKDCFVTLCRQKGKNFWLITHKELDRSRCLSIQNAQIDPEKLLKEWEQKGFEFVVKQFQTDILKKSDVPDYVSERDIKEFIYFATHSKNFDRKQKLQRDSLLARDMAKRNKRDKNNINSDNTHRNGVSCEYISPVELQNFLLVFNQDDILKYTCHPIDSEEVINDINEKCGTDTYSVEQHSKILLDRFEELFKNERNSRNMRGLIYAYLSGSKEWSNNRVKINWKSPELIEWANANPGKVASPGRNIAVKQRSNGFRLPEPFSSVVSGRRIASFTELVIFFKSLFHIRRDNSLRNNISYINRSIDNVDIKFSENFNEGIELFTDVDKLLQAYKNIIKICADCSVNDESPIIEISFYKDEKNVYLCIHHTNTKYGKTKDDSLKRIGESQSDLIKNQINGLCDLFIEADFGNEEYARINLWDESDELKAVNIAELQGVKYILRF